MFFIFVFETINWKWLVMRVDSCLKGPELKLQHRITVGGWLPALFVFMFEKTKITEKEAVVGHMEQASSIPLRYFKASAQVCRYIDRLSWFSWKISFKDGCGVPFNPLIPFWSRCYDLWSLRTHFGRKSRFPEY